MTSITAALTSVYLFISAHKDEDRGATAVEYGLMVALIAAVIAGVVLLLGNSLHGMFSNVNDCVGNTANCAK